MSASSGTAGGRAVREPTIHSFDEDPVPQSVWRSKNLASAGDTLKPARGKPIHMQFDGPPLSEAEYRAKYHPV